MKPRNRPAVILSDLSCCQPAASLSRHEHAHRWHLLPYRTCEGNPREGILLGAPSYVHAPEVTLPLTVTGWHDVRIGFWIRKHDYDGPTTVKVRLDTDPCFVRLSEPAPLLGGATLLKEAHFKAADLTGRRLVFSKIGGASAQKAYIAYVSLMPLDDNEVRAIRPRPGGLFVRLAQFDETASMDSDPNTRPPAFSGGEGAGRFAGQCPTVTGVTVRDKGARRHQGARSKANR